MDFQNCLRMVSRFYSFDIPTFSLELGTSDKSERDNKYFLQVLTKTARDSQIYRPRIIYAIACGGRLSQCEWRTCPLKAFLPVIMVTSMD